jgi:uncharacterized tellurite resistance protein B-like protein
MSIITKFLAVVTEPQFKLARDLTAVAIADGQVTPEEKEAMSTICHLEGIDENKLMEALRGGYDKVNEEMPNSRQEKEVYLRDIIKLIGADGYSAPQEVYLFQIIASRMGLNQMDVIGLFLLTATRQYFKGDAGARILASFLKNYIDPKGKTDKSNRENLCTIYDTVASNTPISQDKEVDKEILRQNLARATEVFLENKILIKEFADVGLDFSIMARQEEQNVFKKYVSS